MKKITFLLLSALALLQANAQKLPQVQQVSLRSPANVKIDGKATEWGEFKAQNSATDILYTIANDDKKLYLTVHIEAGKIVNRAVMGGIKLVIQTNGSKKQKNAVGIKFPFFEKGKLIFFPLKMIGEANTPAHNDSIMKVYNKRIANNVKWIYTQGIAGVDSVLSVYNDKGIQAACSFDRKREYTCEMAIDLALLGLRAQQKFAYYIGINTEPNKMSSSFSRIGASGKNSDGTDMNEAQLAAIGERLQNTVNVAYATTDFWGEYTLAK